jgi:hypothetical protein
MLDLILVKLTEHAIKAINPPKAGITLIHSPFNNYLTVFHSIPYTQDIEEDEVMLKFPIGTTVIKYYKESKNQEHFIIHPGQEYQFVDLDWNESYEIIHA